MGFKNWSLGFILSGFSLMAHAQLNASFVPSRSQGCAPLQVTFSNTSTGNPDSCFWDLGISGNTSTLFSPAAIYNLPGTYTVKLTVFKGNQSSSTSRAITVFKDPVADFTVDKLSGCEPLTVKFTEQVTLGDAPLQNVQWDYGDGIVDSSRNPAHRYDFYGFKSVSLIAIDANGCKNTILKPNYLNILDRPAADITSVNNENCKVPATVNFDAVVVCTAPVQTYNWNYGDGNSGTGNPSSHTYNTQGTYGVQLIVKAANGCLDTLQKNDFVKLVPIRADFNVDSFSGCVPLKVKFSDSTNFTNITTSWDFKDGLTSTDKNPVHTFYGPGNYNVTLTSTLKNTTCSNSISKIISVQQTPAVDFSMSSTSSCKDQLVQFTNLSTGAVNYKWFFINAETGQADTSTLKDPAYLFTSSGSTDYHIRLVAESSFGCTAEIYRPRAFRLQRDSIVIEHDYNGGCVPFKPNFRANVYGPWPVSSYQWDFGDGNTGMGATVSHTYNSSGRFFVKLTSTIPGCNSYVCYDTIQAGPRDNTYSGSFDLTDVCVHRDSVHFVATGGMPGTELTWSVGDNYINSPDFKYTYFIPSFPLMYQVRLIATNMGCSDTTTVGEIMVRPPLARFRIIPPCGNSRTVTIINQSVGADSSILSLGDGTKLYNVGDTIQYTYPGTDTFFIIRLLTYNFLSGCTDTTLRSVRFSPNSYDIIFDVSKGCLFAKPKFIPTGYDASDSLYWEFSDHPGQYIGAFATYHTFVGPGIYSAKLFIKKFSGCLDSFEKKYIIVVSELKGTLVAEPQGGCASKNYLLKANITSPYSPVLGYDWIIDGNTFQSNTNIIPWNFPDTGIFQVTVKLKNDVNCDLIMTTSVYVKDKFAAFSTSKDTICKGVALAFKNLSSGDSLSYLWNFGDNTTSRNRDASHAYNTTGTYMATLIVTDQTGCADTARKQITVTTLSVDFSADNRFRSCPELLTNYNLISTTTHFDKLVWNFGNGNESVGLNPQPSAIYTYSGNFNASLKAFDAYGCVDSILKSNYVIISGPQGNFSFNPKSGCTPVAVEFSGTFSNAKSLVWDFGDGASYTDSILPFRDTITHQYISNGNFTPSIIIRDNDNCVVNVPSREVIKTGTIQAKILPSATYVCDSGTVSLQDASVFTNNNFPLSFQWSVNDNNSGSNNTLNKFLVYDPAHNPQKIKLLVTSAYGCSSSDSVYLKLYRTPKIKVDTSKIICKDEDVILHASGTKHYTWYPAVTQINDSTFKATPAASGYYYVTAYEDSIGCNISDSVYVNVITKVDVSATTDTYVCFMDTVQLLAYASNTSNNLSSFLWTPDFNIHYADSQNPYVFPLTDRTYSVTISNGKCIPQTLPVRVTVKPLPTVDAGLDTIIIAGMSTQLEATSSNYVSYEWIPDYYLSCNDCPHAVASPLTTTFYKVIATDTFGCKAMDMKLVRVIEKCNENAVLVPNLFTPNGNGQNDVLHVLGPGVENVLSFRIYDRWGKLLFESKDFTQGWDGTYNGEALQPGVYIYYVEVKCINNQTTVKRGDVTLLR